jgi:hypothetical protein
VLPALEPRRQEVSGSGHSPGSETDNADTKAFYFGIFPFIYNILVSTSTALGQTVPLLKETEHTDRFRNGWHHWSVRNSRGLLKMDLNFCEKDDEMFLICCSYS